MKCFIGQGPTQAGIQEKQDSGKSTQYYKLKEEYGWHYLTHMQKGSTSQWIHYPDEHGPLFLQERPSTYAWVVCTLGLSGSNILQILFI